MTQRRQPRRLVKLLHGATALGLATGILWVAGQRRAAAIGAPNRFAFSLSASANEAGNPTPAEFQTYRSLGKAYYEQAEYKEAVAEFRKVVASGHALALDHLDLAQALIQANNLNEALEELITAKQMAPRLRAVDYNLGILYKHELLYPKAEAELKQVAAADPGDPPTWFNLGEVYFAEHELEPSLHAFERVVGMGYAKAQNFYVAATFHCFTILTRLKQPEEAQKYLKLNMATRNKVPGISLQYPALEAGKYGEVEIAAAPLTPSPVPPAELVFENVTSKLGFKPSSLVLRPNTEPAPAFSRRRGSTLIEPGPPYATVIFSLSGRRGSVYVPLLFGRSVAVGNYDSDGHPNIYVADPSAAGTLAAEFVDYNNSGHPSLVIAGLGGLTLYKNNGNGTSTNVTRQAGLKGNPCELDTDVKALDFDNDGLLDLVVTGYTNLCKHIVGKGDLFPDSYPNVAPHLYHNNGDGTFTDITASSGLRAARGHFRQVIFADFNNDGYMDLLFLRDDGPPMLFLNQGGDKFVNRTMEAGPALANSRADEAAVSDFNHDGKFDLALFGPNGYSVLLNRGDAHFEAIQGLPMVKPLHEVFARHGAVADLDGNSFDDLLVKDQYGGWHALLNYGGRFREAPLKFLGLPVLPGGNAGGVLFPPLEWETDFTASWLTHPGDVDLLSGSTVFQREGPAPHWIEVHLLGYKSNKPGVGDVIELKAGNFYNKVLARHGDPVRVFTGNLSKLDVVRVTWPNQVVENDVNVRTDQAIDMKESARLASSCPFLYVWNGKRFVFSTDIMGVSPLGELAPDGTTLQPNPQQLVRLGSRLLPRNGNYVLQVTDEMREVDYFDQLRLLAVDHPATESVYANEIYSATPTPPQLYFVRRKRFPISAVDGHGNNVLPLIRYADGRYPANFHQNRILGLAALHSLTLNLGRFPQSPRVALWLQGWVFWTDSNASRALMMNRHLKMIDPYLQVRNRAGKWVTVVPDIGLPAGTERTMRVNLTGKFLTTDHHVRIVTNLCVYWDQIFFTTDESPASDSFALPLASADLHYRGFSAVTTDPTHRIPDFFDYARLMKAAPWNPASGIYTRYGPVRELLANADDELVIMASGDEMTAAFSASHLPRLKPGWRRDFFLYAVGYAKDGEPNTEFSRTVAPMPFRAMRSYSPPGSPVPSGPAYQRYVRRYETRPGYKLIPPLAPPGD